LTKIHVLHDAPMQHHFKLTVQNFAPFGTIPSHLVHGEPFGSLVQNFQFGFFLMMLYNKLDTLIKNKTSKEVNMPVDTRIWMRTPTTAIFLSFRCSSASKLPNTWSIILKV
jgi:hypothetical protein